MAVKKIVKRILEKKAPVEPIKPSAVVYVEPKKTGGCVECGEPLAEGQTYVCKSHIRRG